MNKIKQTWRWYFKLPGNFYAYGPTVERFHTEREVREYLRNVHFDGKRLPRGTEVWKAMD